MTDTHCTGMVDLYRTGVADPHCTGTGTGMADPSWTLLAIAQCGMADPYVPVSLIFTVPVWLILAGLY